MHHLPQRKSFVLLILLPRAEALGLAAARVALIVHFKLQEVLVSKEDLKREKRERERKQRTKKAAGRDCLWAEQLDFLPQIQTSKGLYRLSSAQNKPMKELCDQSEVALTMDSLCQA